MICDHLDVVRSKIIEVFVVAQQPAKRRRIALIQKQFDSLLAAAHMRCPDLLRQCLRFCGKLFLSLRDLNVELLLALCAVVSLALQLFQAQAFL